jgi:cell division protein FtsL
LFSELQTLEQARDTLHVKSSQLLLEQNTWAAPVRVQAMAQQQLGMVVPVSKDIVTIVRSKAVG